MSKKTFSKQDIKALSKNKYVRNVSEKSITYTNKFKINFITKYNNGELLKNIFEEAGFDINIIGLK